MPRFSSATAPSAALMPAYAEELRDHVERSADDLADDFEKQAHPVTTVA
ncbi:hypothetical protein [Leifsonia sp. ALI-44-B]|nr:hypothetical protein [Leifsonia sp. ALI-44-B]